MKEPDENDKLWELLGKSSRVEASPYFARKVRHAVESTPRHPALFFSRVIRWLIPVSACAAVALAWNAYTWRMEQNRIATQFNELFDEAADLQSLVASQDISSWIASGN